LLEEYDAQMKLVAGERARGVGGSIFFSAKPLVSDQAGLRTALATSHWATPAAPPPLAMVALASAGPLRRSSTPVARLPSDARSIAVYRERAEAHRRCDLIDRDNGGAHARAWTVGHQRARPSGRREPRRPHHGRVRRSEGNGRAGLKSTIMVI